MNMYGDLVMDSVPDKVKRKNIYYLDAFPPFSLFFMMWWFRVHRTVRWSFHSNTFSTTTHKNRIFRRVHNTLLIEIDRQATISLGFK